jgi:hypothetical protein
MSKVNPDSDDIKLLKLPVDLVAWLISKEGVSIDQLHNVNNDTKLKARLGNYVRAECPEINDDGMVEITPDLLTELFGDGFVSAEELASVMGYGYTSQQKLLLQRRLPSVQRAIQLYKNDCILIPTPPQKQTFADLAACEKYPLIHKETDWFYEENQSFAHFEDVPDCSWIAIGKFALENSFGKKLVTQMDILNQVRGRYCPTAIEVHYCLSVLALVRGERYMLDSNQRVRTSSISFCGSSVVMIKSRGDETRFTDSTANHLTDKGIGIAYAFQV